MRILAILSAMPEVHPSFRVEIPILSPPMTLPLLAAICEKGGHSVEQLDTRFYSERHGSNWVLNWERVRERIEASGAAVACVSFLSSSAREGFEIARLCKKAGMTVVGGGLHASVALDEFIASGNFHYILLGEAELSLPQFLRDLENGACERRPPAPQVIRSEVLRRMDAVPVTDLSYYQPVFDQYLDYRGVYVEISRGCFKECGFCEVARSGAAFSPLRKIPLTTVLANLERTLSRHKVNYVIVADSIATLFKDHFKEVVAYFRRHHPEVVLQFNSTVDRWDRGLAEACSGMRCNVWFGFESGSQRVLDTIIKKGTKVEQAYEAARICREFAIPCAFNILLGLPGERPEEAQETLEVLSALNWVFPNPNIFNPLPGTELYTFCKKENLLEAEGDYTIWDAERLAREGRGPVRTVDYGRVMEYRDRYVGMQAEAGRSLEARQSVQKSDRKL